MSTGTLTTVDFHGATLLAMRGETPETTLVAMKPVVEGMGLDWSNHLKKIKANPVLSKGMVVITIPSDGGIQEATALPLTRLSFWLATVHPDRIKDASIRARIIEYQTECADVLFAHFFGKASAAPAATGEVMEARPWAERSVEERSIELRTIATIGRYGNPALAYWYMVKQARVAEFPRHLQPAWWQADMNLGAPKGNDRSVTIIMPNGGALN